MDIKTEIPSYFQMDKNEKFELNSLDDYKSTARYTYKAAVGFYIISQKCMDMILSEYNNQICTNIAFSCELFFKSILFENKIDCRNQHNLYKLYTSLPEIDKENIKKLHLKGNIHIKDFELNLKEIGQAFIVLRYSYERKRMAYNLQFLLELLIALNEICTKRFKEIRK